MSYTINDTTGATVVILKDGTIDTTTTDISLFGKGYAGFGEKLNENFVKLLENFSNTTAPDNKVKGQLWYDATNNQVNVYTGVKWKPVGGSTTTITQPTSSVKGDMWFDTTNSQLYVYSGNDWVLIGPTSVAGSGVTLMVPEVVESSLGTNKNILKGVVGDTVIYVVASEEFNPKNTAGTPGAELITAGFSTVYKGITLSSALAGNKFQGTATLAEGLYDTIGAVAISASQFLRADANDTTSGSLGVINDSGVTIGADSDLTLSISGLDAKLKNNTNNGTLQLENNTVVTGDLTITGTLTSAESVSTSVSTLDVEDNMIRMKQGPAGSVINALVNFTGLQVNRGASSDDAEGPSSPNLQDAFWVWDESFADDGTTTYGNAGGAWTAFRSGNNLNDRYLVDLRANVVHAVATQAQYADLAEKYSTDEDYPIGTVISVATEGEKEATASQLGSIPIGVVSENPAYLMNADADGQIVGLKGRVPVKVIGQVNKGDAVYVGDTVGVAIPWNHYSVASKNADVDAHMVGVSLVNSDNSGIKLVECVLKL